MRRIRIGKDIQIRWKIFTNGEAVSLRDRNLKLVLHHSLLPEQELSISIDPEIDNRLITTFRGVDQKMTGNYRLTLWENFGGNGQSVLDYCNAFTLVSTTCEEDGSVVGLDDVTLDIEDGNLIIGVPGNPGMSAYELFKKYNPDSPLTAQEYAEAPVDAAQGVEDAIKEVNETNKVVTEAENLRVEAENGRVDAENKRNEAETGRSDAEDERKQSETKRVESESQRTSAEETRKSNEALRVIAEEARAASEAERVNAESARVAAETKREAQEKSRKDAEAIRASNEEGRVSAEQKRVVAEKERADAEQEREQSVSQALTDMSSAISNAESATSAANTAAGKADAAAQSADTAAGKADTAAVRADALADNPPKIVEEDGVNYWAFYDIETQQYVTSEFRADDGTILAQVKGPDVSLDVVGGTMYVCGELTSLNIASVENSTKPSIIRFTSGATATQFSYPENFNITGWTKPEENKSYTICILFGAGNMTYDE